MKDTMRTTLLYFMGTLRAKNATEEEKISSPLRSVVSFPRRNDRSTPTDAPPHLAQSFLCCKPTTDLRGSIFSSSPSHELPHSSIITLCLTPLAPSLCYVCPFN